MYKIPFLITDNVSNNAFSFEKRKKPSVYVADIRDGMIDDVRIGDKIVFEDFDENGNLKSCAGLKYFVCLKHPKTEKQIVIMDNHNHAFYFWHEARNKGLIKNKSTLIHIDQHKDAREPSSYLGKQDSENLEKVFEYTNSVLNVGNYILPAMRDGLVGEVIQITGEKELINHTPESGQSIAHFQGRRRSESSIILNIDLDFWAPEMDYIDPKIKIDCTKEWMARADFITIATSPFFIDQARALDVLMKRLFAQ